MQRVMRAGKTYAVREGKLIEIETLNAGVNAKTVKAKRGRRHIGCPLAFLADVCRLTEGRIALVVAQYIYRRTHVCRSQTVTLPGKELAELGIARRKKNEALVELRDAGLIEIEQQPPGRSTKVTSTWQPS